MIHTIKPFLSKLAVAAALTLTFTLQSCNEAPDKFFGITVLNTNTISDFGTPILAKHIDDETTEFPDIPSSKKKGDEATQYVVRNLSYMEKSLKDIKALGEGGDDRKEIKAQSIALYEYVIPVYKNEYTAYAKLCDTKAPQEQKDEIIKSIAQKYNAEFERKYGQLLASGKTFADKHGINVDWK